jgi:hypothetical protein
MDEGVAIDEALHILSPERPLCVICTPGVAGKVVGLYGPPNNTREVQMEETGNQWLIQMEWTEEEVACDRL